MLCCWPLLPCTARRNGYIGQRSFAYPVVLLHALFLTAHTHLATAVNELALYDE